MPNGRGRSGDRDQPVRRVRPAEQPGRIELGRIVRGRGARARAIGSHLVAHEQSGPAVG